MMIKTDVSFLDAGNLKLGVIEAYEPLKASLVCAEGLKNKVEKTIGWPNYAVTPSRGFVYLLAKSQHGELSNIGRVVVDEYSTAEYPISTEVWEINESGVEAIGAFPSAELMA